jgi:hypothetical protein
VRRLPDFSSNRSKLASAVSALGRRNVDVDLDRREQPVHDSA